MHDDPTFRALLAVGAAALVPVLAYHRLRSQATRERLGRRQERLFVLVSLRLLGLLFFAAFAAYLWDPASLSWSSLALPSPARWAGAALFPVGAALAVWAFVSLGKNLTDTVVTRKEDTLVTGGPYRWVRHPFYVAVALLVAAVGLLTANGLLAATGAAVFGLLVVRTRREEEKLRERFGEEYRRYCEQTGRFLPHPGRQA